MLIFDKITSSQFTKSNWIISRSFASQKIVFNIQTKQKHLLKKELPSFLIIFHQTEQDADWTR